MKSRWPRPIISYGLNVDKRCRQQKLPEAMATTVAQYFQEILYKHSTPRQCGNDGIAAI